MRVYYSHAMKVYGTKEETVHRAIITDHFPGSTLVDPGTMQSNPEKARRGMEYCLELVDTCDSLVFVRYMEVITAGVGKEVNHALSRGKPVFELERTTIRPIKEPVDYLSREQTVALYRV
jgi:hypothetical protein